jgi:2-polyprenyl-6-methoxyphenol hydroxylase-like FAD-dependent oxidoreductase
LRIAINGAGIAGPALAFWLRRCGHDVLLIELAPQLRRGGYIIDFWGVGYDIVEKMGLIARVRELGYQVGEVRFVDSGGRKSGGFSVDVFGRLTGDRFTSVQRSALAATIYDALDGVETLLGDSVAAIDDDGERVRISFEHAPPRDVDLLIGADGLHSRVRELAFGPQSRYEVSLGYHVAAFEAPAYRPRDELVYVSYSAPGRQVSRFAMRDDRTMFLFVFADEHMSGPEPANDAQRKAALHAIFAGLGWECAQILATLDAAGEVYFDRVSQIRMDAWSKGRVALVGDAAACVSLLAGEGTGLAIAESFVLAGELQACKGDHAMAFALYQQRLMPFLQHKQRSAAKFATSFAPKTALGLSVRNAVTRLLRIGPVADWFIGRDLRDDIELPGYGF